MFDVGFTELVLLFVIGLLILGPERLPRVASQLGRWMGKARRTAHQLRMQLEREMTMNDIMREKKDREQNDGEAGASASETTDSTPDSTDSSQPEDNYPEEEDANHSGHNDAGADDDAPDVSPADATTSTGDDDSPQQRRA